MIRKSLVIVSLLWLQGCVGTVKIAKENEANNLGKDMPIITKAETVRTENKSNNETEKK